MLVLAAVRVTDQVDDRREAGLRLADADAVIMDVVDQAVAAEIAIAEAAEAVVDDKSAALKTSK
jgi:hypothetical protein